MFKVFVSCKFDENCEPSEFVKNCIQLGKIVDLDLRVINEPNAGDIRAKIKEAIRDSVGIIFILEEFTENGSVYNSSHWISTEYEMADSLNLPMGLINNSKLKKPSTFPDNLEELGQNRLADRNIIQYLNSLKKRIETETLEWVPTFDREFIKHKVAIRPDGRAKYMTNVKIKALLDGVETFEHSIYTKYLQCWELTNTDYVPNIDVICDTDRTISTNLELKTNKKCTWSFILNRPLMKFEEFSYFFVCEFPELYPMTKENLKRMTEIPNYPFPEGTIEHHFYINKPTKRLEIELFFEDARVSKNFQPLVFNGRKFSQGSLNQTETQRIKNCFREQLRWNEKNISLTVDNPKFDSTYSINWELED